MSQQARIKSIAETTRLAQTDIKKVLEALVGEIAADLSGTGRSVLHKDLGVLEVKHRPERQGRNPASGEAITLAASNSVKFKACKHLKEFVNN